MNNTIETGIEHEKIVENRIDVICIEEDVDKMEVKEIGLTESTSEITGEFCNLLNLNYFKKCIEMKFLLFCKLRFSKIDQGEILINR